MIHFFCLWFLLPAVAWGQQAPGPQGKKAQVRSVIKLMERGRYVGAVKAADRILESQPRASAALALKGIALSRMGMHANALPLLDRSAGIAVYSELGGVGAHANSLRAAGRGAEAWRVRSRRIHPAMPIQQKIKTQCHGVDDLLSVGRVSEALILGEAMVLDAPDSPSAHAFYATALLASGDLESAEFHQFLAKRYSVQRIPRIPANRAEIAGHYGDEWSARRSWARARIMRKRDAWIAAGQAEWLLSQGEVASALSTLDQRAFIDQQHPDLLGLRVRLLLAAGNRDAASRALTRFAQLFPDHPEWMDLENDLATE
jgi:Flp pilus assembly protein TadD